MLPLLNQVTNFIELLTRWLNSLYQCGLDQETFVMTGGLHSIFACLQLLKHLNKVEINIVKVVQRNAFFAHPDQLLLAMCTDRDEAARR